jgi:hypothetical protein
VEEARQAFEEALSKYRELAKKNPETYLPYIARTLNSLGSLDRDQKRTADAREAFGEALRGYRQLAERHPET